MVIFFLFPISCNQIIIMGDSAQQINDLELMFGSYLPKLNFTICVDSSRSIGDRFWKNW